MSNNCKAISGMASTVVGVAQSGTSWSALVVGLSGSGTSRLVPIATGSSSSGEMCITDCSVTHSIVPIGDTCTRW